jgi:hypothetical protein
MATQALDFHGRLIESVDRAAHAIGYSDPALAADLSRLRRKLVAQQKHAARLAPRWATNTGR